MLYINFISPENKLEIINTILDRLPPEKSDEVRQKLADTFKEIQGGNAIDKLFRATIILANQDPTVDIIEVQPFKNIIEKNKIYSYLFLNSSFTIISGILLGCALIFLSSCLLAPVPFMTLGSIIAINSPLLILLLGSIVFAIYTLTKTEQLYSLEK